MARRDSDISPSRAGEHPGGGALEHRHLRDRVCDARQGLCGACPGADEGHRTPLKPVFMIPLSRVKTRTRKGFYAGNACTVGQVQAAQPAHHNVRTQLLTVGEGHLPTVVVGVVVVTHARHFTAEVQPGRQAKLIDAVPAVLPDFAATGIAVAPVGVQVKREGVHVRRYVARNVGVGVVPPGTADRLGFLQNHEIGNAALTQFHRHAQPRHAGAEDRDPHPFW